MFTITTRAEIEAAIRNVTIPEGTPNYLIVQRNETVRPARPEELNTSHLPAKSEAESPLGTSPKNR